MPLASNSNKLGWDTFSPHRKPRLGHWVTFLSVHGTSWLLGVDISLSNAQKEPTSTGYREPLNYAPL